MKNFDYIVSGAGLTGLQLCYRMATDVFFDDKKILILDSEKNIDNHKTWSFWDVDKGNWDDVVSHKWKNLKFTNNQFSKEDISNKRHRSM